MNLDAPPGYDLQEELLYSRKEGRGRRIMLLFPPFHASGVIGMVLFPLTIGGTVIYPPT